METVVLDQIALESGDVLERVPVAYRTWGLLNDSADNCIVVCHALTGDTAVDVWWKPLIGPGRAIDTDRFFVVCANVIGSPYGSASPLTTDPNTERRYGADFPAVTIRDTVSAHRRVLEHLSVRRVRLAIGGSMGGMHVLEWAFHHDFVDALVPIAVGAAHSAWCIGWSEAQRQAIYADPHWNGGRYDPDHPPVQGLAAARMMAMISYRTRASFEERFGRERMPGGDIFSAESYLRYQGEKLVGRFDANCYVHLTRQMDSHDLARGRGDMAAVLHSVEQPALVVGIDSDLLYPLEEQRQLADSLPNAELAVIESMHGHDAFLIEFDQLDHLLRAWIKRHVAERPAPRAHALSAPD